MKLSAKDATGLLLAVGTVSLLVAHIGPEGHAARHPTSVADGGGAVTSAIQPTLVAFVDVNVLPMDGVEVLRRQVVVIEDGVIREIGPVGVLRAPSGAQIIAGDGSHYLVPGLTDAHVHLPEDAEDWLPLFIANGVTTVFNLRGAERHLKLRDRVRRGDLLGPTIFTSGPFTNEPEIQSPADARAAVRDQVRRGFDFVKIHGDLSEESFAALTREGRDEGIAIIGHAPRNLPFSSVLENRQTGIAHAEELIYTQFRSLDEAGLGAVAADMAMAGTWLTPTLSTFGNIATQWGTTNGLDAGLSAPTARYLPRSVRERWRGDNPYTRRDASGRSRIEEMYAFQFSLIRAFHAAGIPMLAGTDTPLPVMAPGFSLHNEIAALANAGLSQYDALAAATSNAGRFVRENVRGAQTFGLIVVGARADLVLVSQNPLVDLDRLRTPEGVMVRGHWYDRSALDRMLERSAGLP